MSSAVNGESFLYGEMRKTINGSFEYRLPKLELNTYKKVGKFLNMPCTYLSEFEAGLVYTAPRSSMLSINHHSVEAEWSLGVQVSSFWATYSLGGRYYIAGNSDLIPEGLDAFNTARIGVAF